MIDVAGMAGQVPGWEWFWNWVNIDNGYAYNGFNPATDHGFNADPSTVREKAAINSWLAQMMPQSWFDAYGFPVNVARAQAKDWANAITGWNPYSGVGGVQPAGGGRINGAWPTGTVDNESKGVEFEFVAQPIKGLNISANASKTKASQSALGADLVSFITAAERKYASPAGDLRLWWAATRPSGATSTRAFGPPISSSWRAMAEWCRRCRRGGSTS